MKKLLLTAITVLTACCAFAQNLSWAKQFNGADMDRVMNTHTDASGNTYVTGNFSGTVDFDPGAGTANLTAVGPDDIFVLKLDANGNYAWAYRFTGAVGAYASSGYGVTTDAAGNVIFGGNFAVGPTVDFDPGAGVSNLSAVGANDAFILKFTSTGTFIWAKQFRGKYTEAVFDIVTDASNNIYLTGPYDDTTDFDPGPGVYNLTSTQIDHSYICKLDASGNFIWAKEVSTGDVYTYSIALDASNNVYTTGVFYGSGDFDPGAGTLTLSTGTNNSAYVNKLDASGNFVWAKQMGGTGYDAGRSIAVDAGGNIYTTGVFNGTADFDPGAGTANLVTPAASDVFVSKLDASGNFVWAKQTTGSSSLYENWSNALVLGGSNNIYIAGTLQGTADFDPGSGTYNLAGGTILARDFFVWELSTSGNFVSAFKIGGAGDDHAYSLSKDNSGGIYVTGSFEGTVDFDPSGSVFNMTGYGLYVMKLGSCALPSAAGTVTGTASTCINSTVTYSIAAVSGATGYTWTVPAGATINSGQNTTSINVTFGSTSGNVVVTPTNTCGNGSSSTLPITITPPPTVTFTITSFINVNAAPVSLSGSPSGGTFAGAGVTGSTFNPSSAGLGSKAITYTYTGGNNCTNSASSSVVVYDTSGTVCSTTDTLIIDVNLTGIAPPGNINAVTVYPNPAHDHLVVNNGNISSMTGYSIKITNVLGQIVFNQPVNQQQFYIDLSTFGGNGTYILYVLDAQQTVKSIKEIVLQ